MPQKSPCSPESNSDGMSNINAAADTAIPARLTTNSHVSFIILTLTEAACEENDRRINDGAELQLPGVPNNPANAVPKFTARPQSAVMRSTSINNIRSPTVYMTIPPSKAAFHWSRPLS